jgi:hypothetical protein
MDKKKIPEKKIWLTSFHISKTGLGMAISAKPGLATIFPSQAQLGNEGNAKSNRRRLKPAAICGSLVHF